MAKTIWIWKGKTLNIIMSEFKFKITQSSGYSYEYTVRANEKIDAFAKIKEYKSKAVALKRLEEQALLREFGYYNKKEFKNSLL